VACRGIGPCALLNLNGLVRCGCRSLQVSFLLADFVERYELWRFWVAYGLIVMKDAKDPTRSSSARREQSRRSRRSQRAAAGTSEVAVSVTAAAGGYASGGEPVFIELSRAQVDRVVRAASGAGSMSVLLSGLRDVREALDAAPGPMEDSRLSRSLLSGLLLLACFPADGSYLGNSEVAGMLGMSMSTAHRYISTPVAAGLLERHPGTRRYRLAR